MPASCETQLPDRNTAHITKEFHVHCFSQTYHSSDFSKKLNYDHPSSLWQQQTFRYSRTDSSVFRIALDRSVLHLAELTEQRDTDYFFYASLEHYRFKCV